MRVEIVAVGTELLLGQIPDTNSQWLGEHLAAHGIASQFHQHVGDNHERILLAFRTALARSDAVIVCGGLGPTQDDITRAALAEVMNVPLERDEEIVEKIRAMFGSRGRTMPRTTSCRPTCRAGRRSSPNARHGAGTDLCRGPKGRLRRARRSYEMTDMFERAILPDLVARQIASGTTSVITSRVLRTWARANRRSPKQWRHASKNW